MNIGIKKAFILVGGLGTRLRPITLELSKLILPVQGKPCLQWNLELVKRFGVRDITLAVGFKHQQIEEKFGKGGGPACLGKASPSAGAEKNRRIERFKRKNVHRFHVNHSPQIKGDSHLYFFKEKVSKIGFNYSSCEG